MSDAGSPPPPPPPPNLTPPPSYEGYTPNLSEAMPLRRVGGLRTAILVLLGVYFLAAVVSLAATPAVTDAADEFLDGVIDEDEFVERLAVNGLAEFLAFLVTVAIGVLTIIWLHRIVANHRAIGRRGSWGPGWAIGGWFVPPIAVYAVPMLVLRESWKASDPTVPPGDERWRQSPVHPIVYVWWVLYGLAPIIFIAAGVTLRTGNLQEAEDLADSLRDSPGLTIAEGLVGLASAIAWALLVRWLTARHTELTGEAQRR